MSLFKLTVSAALFFCSLTCLARGNDLIIKDGMGEEISVQDRLFGGNKQTVKDRMGNKYEKTKKSFGRSDTQIGLFGNTVKRKKGLFGSTSLEANTVFGDKLTSKKGWFGKRKTEVDISGTTGLLKGLLAQPVTPPETLSPTK